MYFILYFINGQNLWPAMYLAHVVDPSVVNNSWTDIAAICERDKDLRSKAQRLRRQLADLEREAIAKGLFEGTTTNVVSTAILEQ